MKLDIYAMHTFICYTIVLGLALNLFGWTMSFVAALQIVLLNVNLVLLHNIITVGTMKMWLWDVVSYTAIIMLYGVKEMLVRRVFKSLIIASLHENQES